MKLLKRIDEIKDPIEERLQDRFDSDVFDHLQEHYTAEDDDLCYYDEYSNEDLNKAKQEIKEKWLEIINNLN